MIQIYFDPWMELEAKQHQEELQKEAAIRRLVDETHNTKTAKTPITANVLILIGKGLTEYGNKLQWRFGNQPEGEKPITQQKTMKGNSPEGR